MGRPRRLGVVEASRCEVAAVHLDLRVDRLQRVVGLREQGGVVPCGDVLSRLVELIQPEAVQVRLVPDRESLQARQLARERRRKLGVVLLLFLRNRREAGARRVGRDHEVACPASRSQPRRCAGSSAPPGLGVVCPGTHAVVTFSALNPACVANSTFWSAISGSAHLTPSSSAPTRIE